MATRTVYPFTGSQKRRWAISSAPQVEAFSTIRRIKHLLLLLLLLVLQVGTAVVLLQVTTREVLPLCLQAPTQEKSSKASSLAGSA